MKNFVKQEAAYELFLEADKKQSRRDGTYFRFIGSSLENMINQCFTGFTSSIYFALGKFENTTFDVKDFSIACMNIDVIGKRNSQDYFVKLEIEFTDQRKEVNYYTKDYPGDLDFLAISSMNQSGNAVFLINRKILNGYYINTFVNRESEINPLFRQEARIIFSGNPVMISAIEKY